MTRNATTGRYPLRMAQLPVACLPACQIQGQHLGGVWAAGCYRARPARQALRAVPQPAPMHALQICACMHARHGDPALPAIGCQSGPARPPIHAHAHAHGRRRVRVWRPATPAIQACRMRRRHHLRGRSCWRRPAPSTAASWPWTHCGAGTMRTRWGGARLWWCRRWGQHDLLQPAPPPPRPDV